MIVYAVAGGNLQQIGGDCPSGWIVMTGPRPDESTHLYTAQADGTWTVTQETLDGTRQEVEDNWRLTEMPQARENRIAIAEMGDTSIPGTAKQWQDYWLALRDWKDGNPDFPDMSKRPKAPTGE